MKKILKKAFNRSISLFLVLTLVANNAFAMEPEINENALIAMFRKKSSSNTGFCTNPSDSFTGHDVQSLCYEQPGGTYGEEIRDVYVWNLPGVATVESIGLCTVIANFLRDASRRLDSGSAVKLIERGKKIRNAAISAELSPIAFDVIKDGCKFLGVTPEMLLNGFKRCMGIFKIGNPEKMSEVLCKCVDKVSSNGAVSKFAPYAPYVLGAVLSAISVAVTLAGCAAINEDARNIADAETIISTFLSLIVNQKYLGANIVVMARDNTSIPWYNPFKNGKIPYIGFWRHDGLRECGAPIFESNWPSRDMPEWARQFTTITLEITVERLTNPCAQDSTRKALEDAKKSLDRTRRKALAALPGGGSSRYAVEDEK